MPLLAAALPACRNITTNTTTNANQSISIFTEPASASCTLTRDGTVIRVVNPSSGTVTVSKSSRDIDVCCTRAGQSTRINIVTTHNSR